jgi:hypothetical protein
MSYKASRYTKRGNATKQGESAFSNRLKVELRKAFPTSKWWKNHGTEYSERGMSDLMGVVDGKLIALEVKINNGWFSPLQVKFLRDINLAGGNGLGILKNDSDVYLIPVSAMGRKGNRHRELWHKINYPDDLSTIEFFGDYE